MKAAADLTSLPEADRSSVFGMLANLGTKGKVSEVVYPDTARKVGVIVQLTDERNPTRDEIQTFRIKQKAKEQISDIYSSRIQRMWFNPQWYVQSGYPGYRSFRAPSPAGPGPEKGNPGPRPLNKKRGK